MTKIPLIQRVLFDAIYTQSQEPQRPNSSLCAFWIANNANFLHTSYEDSDQTARMRRLIWVFDGSTCQTVRFLRLWIIWLLSLRMKTLAKWLVRPVKTQISLGIHPVWSESSLCPQWVVKDPSFLHTDSKDSDQTGRMPRLIWVFAGRTWHLFRFCRALAQLWSSLHTYKIPWSKCSTTCSFTFVVRYYLEL